MAINLCKYSLMFLCLMNNVLGACCCSSEKTTEVKLKPEDEKQYIAKALGINEKDIWYFEKIVNKTVSLDGLSTRANNWLRFAESYIVTLAMSTVDEYGDIDWKNCISFVALINNDIEFNIQANLLQPIPDFEKFLSDNRGKIVKYIFSYGHTDYCICQ